ncbi:ankyrin repeat domain-containing protein 26-like [Camelus ferus]|uniref:Ankyrin repeat domain-containing protein 26-like n=2 Tax=Camelus TaxID=9836 RepID=A0A8B8SJT9_CAMFR|nr:ankyrin repeat domain-containing protein 26-like [Camelus ferus]
MNTKLQMAEEYKSSVLKTVPTRPAEKFNNSLEHKWTLTRSRNFRIFSEPSTSTSDCLFRMHKKLENNASREVKEATPKLQSESYRTSLGGSSKESRLIEDMLLKACKEYEEVLKKKYLLYDVTDE